MSVLIVSNFASWFWNSFVIKDVFFVIAWLTLIASYLTGLQTLMISFEVLTHVDYVPTICKSTWLICSSG